MLPLACGPPWALSLMPPPCMVSGKEQEEQWEENVKVTATLLCRGCPIRCFEVCLSLGKLAYIATSSSFFLLQYNLLFCPEKRYYNSQAIYIQIGLRFMIFIPISVLNWPPYPSWSETWNFDQPAKSKNKTSPRFPGHRTGTPC